MDVFTLIAKWGISTLVIAVISIVLMGVLKLCKLFTKIKSADIKKIIYTAIQAVFGFGFSALYYVIFRIPFDLSYVGYSIAVVSITIIGYHYYETIGLRKFVRWLLGIFAKWFAANPNNKIDKSLKKLGLTEDQINAVHGTINAEAAKNNAPVVEPKN